jgi:hypothetical protein
MSAKHKHTGLKHDVLFVMWPYMEYTTIAILGPAMSSVTVVSVVGSVVGGGAEAGVVAAGAGAFVLTGFTVGVVSAVSKLACCFLLGKHIA